MEEIRTLLVDAVENKRKLECAIEDLSKQWETQYLQHEIRCLIQESDAKGIAHIDAAEAVGYRITFASGVTMEPDAFRCQVHVKYLEHTFVLRTSAICIPTYVFKHKLKAVREAVNFAIEQWRKLDLRKLTFEITTAGAKRARVEFLEKL
jgi:hypothetical protein